MKLTREGLEVLADKGARIQLSDFTNENDKKELIQLIEKYKKAQEERKNCPHCKKNLADKKNGGFVCSYHYHDLVICHQDDCFYCVLETTIRDNAIDLYEEITWGYDKL